MAIGTERLRNNRAFIALVAIAAIAGAVAFGWWVA